MYGYIYRTINLINGRKYIGQHKSENFDSSYIGSGKLLKQAVEKYGKNCFSCEILQPINGVPTVCDDETQLGISENYYINYYNATASEEYYNLCEGGKHRTVKGQIFINNGVREKKIFPEELDHYMSTGWVKGKKHQTQEVISKRVQKCQGQKRTEETKQKISKALKGKQKSTEHVRRVQETKSKKQYEAPNKGKVAVVLNDTLHYVDKTDLSYYISKGYKISGKKHTDEACINHSKAKRGTVAVTDGNITKFVQRDELDSFLARGFVKGRHAPTRPNQKGEKRKWVNNGEKTFMIKQEEIEVYLKNGYVLGRLKFNSN